MKMNPTSDLHFAAGTHTFVSVILPLAVPKPYTYFVPEELVASVRFGVRVEVQFGKNRLYSALVVEVHREAGAQKEPKPILSVLDGNPIITRQQWKLWQWMASYYCCSVGEMMSAALPANLKLASETILVLSPLFDDNMQGLSDKEFIILEALQNREELSIKDVRDILEQKTVYAIVKRLIEKRLIYLKEDLKVKYKPKKIGCVRLQEPYLSEPDLLANAFDLVSRSPKQTEALLAFIQLNKGQDFLRKQDLYNATDKVDNGGLKAMVKKGIFELYDREVSRIADYEDELNEAFDLSPQQARALQEIDAAFEEKNVVLLHGVTGSGKTRVYIERIKEAIERGEQVLYLLPEIALTTQIVQRLKRVFGDAIGVYHSRLNNNERVELWQQTYEGKPVILGARSAMFLPFTNLKFIIVDEEHDPSFKQNDPNPRYHGRDVAAYLGVLHEAKVLLGTATPSIESYQNATKEKYALVEMKARFGGLSLPEIVLVDIKQEIKRKTMQSVFSSVLLEELTQALERGEQAILFQNRRGYSPRLHCETCGWHQECAHCDVSLTYHKFQNTLKCHYCGFTMSVPEACPACGVVGLNLKGFGTEKIEDELKIYLPKARIARMDFDTVRSKNGLAQLINDFEERRLDILVGTQMVTKGLDFDNVGIVGVMSADQLLQFPDFRASERAFQLMTQVSGRAGRKHKQGKVIIQTYNPAHPVIREVIDGDFKAFFTREIMERRQFAYVPYVRMIRVTLRHKKPQVVNDATRIFEKHIKKRLGTAVIGPAVPSVGRVRGYYLLDFLIKLERNAQKMHYAKQSIQEIAQQVRSMKGFSGVRIKVDVDPG